MSKVIIPPAEQPSSDKKLSFSPEAQAEIDRCVGEQQERYRQLFSEFERVSTERTKYLKALEAIAMQGRNLIAEEALGLSFIGDF